MITITKKLLLLRNMHQIAIQSFYFISISNKCCSLKFLNAAQLFFNTEHQITMISEGSCDTEDWSNGAESSDFITEINYILNIFK